MKFFNDFRSPRLILFLLLCLLPILGGVLGLGLILYGIYNRNKKPYIAIGIIGIISTIIGIAVLNYKATHRGSFDQARIMMAQNTMTSLVKEIEFYKLDFGNYPDSLQMLKKISSHLDLYDPLQDVNPNLLDKNYYYRLSGNKYYLFSKGFDGIPFTNDDIMPNIIIKDTSKIGLIYR